MTYKNLRSGDSVTFKAYNGLGRNGPEYVTRTAKVLRYLTFPHHVMVAHGHNGTVVNDDNYISHKEAGR